MKSLRKTVKKNIQSKQIKAQGKQTFKDYWNEIIKALIATK
ncbi:hypothetical protein ACQKII_02200 [Lysinibacillus sp. NPDC048646]